MSDQVSDIVLAADCAMRRIQIGRVPPRKHVLALTDAAAELRRIPGLIAQAQQSTPPATPDQAADRFRCALRDALRAGVRRDELVAIFNGDEAS